MKKNMGNTDRVIRVILAAVFILLYFYGAVPYFLSVLLLILAVVFIVTSFIGNCPLYSLFSINTCGRNARN